MDLGSMGFWRMKQGKLRIDKRRKLDILAL
jgi:hypothetical protein